MERRRHTRARALKSARILLNRHQSAIDCIVRNLSPNGACLTLSSTLGIPDRFDVLFDADKSIRACRLVWYNERELGVEFVDDEEAPLTRSA